MTIILLCYGITELSTTKSKFYYTTIILLKLWNKRLDFVVLCWFIQCHVNIDIESSSQSQSFMSCGLTWA